MDQLSKELGSILPESRVAMFHRGSAGLYHLFRAIRVVGGVGEVVVPNLCCETVALAAYFAGHRVIFCDVDIDRPLVTPETLAEALSASTVAVVIVHLFGLTIDPLDFKEIRKEHPQVVFIEDIAHAVGGCDKNGCEVGHGFDHAMFSFSTSKILGGEGGVVATHRDDEISDVFHRIFLDTPDCGYDPLLALSLRNLVHAIADLHRAGSEGAGGDVRQAIWERFRPLIVGRGNFSDPGSAASDLRDRGKISRRRNDLAMLFLEENRNPQFKVPTILESETIWRLPVIAESEALRRRATEAIRRSGISVSNHYFPLNRLFGAPALPASESVSDRLINLWVDDTVTKSQIRTVAKLLNEL